jgi:hypothetical protein
MKECRITFLGKRWLVRWVARLGSKRGKRGGVVGDCSPPDQPSRTIRVQAGLSRSEEREILIHELTHAAFYAMDEGAVRSFAANLNAALTKLGHPAE